MAQWNVNSLEAIWILCFGSNMNGDVFQDD